MHCLAWCCPLRPQLSGSDFSQCQLLNQSICDPIADLKSFAGVVYNLEAQYVTQDLRIPVCCDDLEVVNATGDAVEYLLTPTPAGMGTQRACRTLLSSGAC